MGLPSAALTPLRDNDGAKKSASELLVKAASACLRVITRFVRFANDRFTTKDEV